MTTKPFSVSKFEALLDDYMKAAISNKTLDHYAAWPAQVESLQAHEDQTRLRLTRFVQMLLDGPPIYVVMGHVNYEGGDCFHAGHDYDEALKIAEDMAGVGGTNDRVEIWKYPEEEVVWERGS